MFWTHRPALSSGVCRRGCSKWETRFPFDKFSRAWRHHEPFPRHSSALVAMLPAKPERGVWSQDEHDRFLKALQLYPDGPWRAVAEYVGSRSVRQVQTHAQKYHEKVARRLRGLRKERKRVQHPEHRIDDEMLEICQTLQRTTQSDLRTALPSDKPLRFADLLDEEQPAIPTAEMFICVEAEKESLKGIDTPSFNECMDFLIDMLGSNEKFVASIAYGSDSESEMSA